MSKLVGMALYILQVQGSRYLSRKVLTNMVQYMKIGISTDPCYNRGRVSDSNARTLTAW